jgi:MFS family permease
LNRKRGSNADVRSLAERYRLAVQESNRGHYVAAERVERRGSALGIASAGLGIVVATSIFATLQASPSSGWRIAAGILAAAAAVLAAMETFLGYGKRAAEHRSAGAAYGRLRREFDVFLLEFATAKDRRILLSNLEELRRRMDELGETSSLIPPRSYKAAMRQIEQLNQPRATRTAVSQ